MSETRFCIICGDSFKSDDPEAVFCPEHGGKAPATSHQETRLDAGPQRTVHQPGDPGATRFEGKGTFDADQEAPRAIEPPAQDLADWTEGKVILDTYEVKGKLGEGGFGKVYRAHHRGWNMDLAIKRALNLDEENKQDFINEAQKWIDLGLHPHIISCYYVRNIDGFPHTFAELAEGGSLHDWIKEDKGNLYEGNEQEVLARILDLAIQFAWGLAYAHEQGLVHGDVKPQNALMTLEGVLKVTDFGLARAGREEGDAGEGEPAQQKIFYSPYHCSPEQRMGKPLTLATDVWSWAVSVLEMFNGGVSWMGGQVAGSALESYIQRAGEDDIPPMPGAVAELLRDCFQEDPQARPKDMLTVAERLVAIYQQETGKAYYRESPKPADLRADSLNNRALSMLDLGDEPEAVRFWQEALDEDPTHGQANLNYWVYQWRQAQTGDDEVVAHLGQVAGTKLDDGVFWRGLGLVHAERGDAEQVETCFQKAHKLLSGLETPAFRNQFALEKALKGHTEQVFAFGLDPTQKILASGADDDTIRLWDLQTGQCKVVLHNTSFTTSFDFSPDGHFLASGHAEKWICIWDLERNRLWKKIKGHTDVVTSVAFSQDGSRVISGSLDGTARVWDARSGACTYVYGDHQHWVVSLLVVPDTELVLSSGRDQVVRLWDLHTGRTRRTYERPRSERKAEYGNLALQAGKVLWAGYDKMCLWHYESGELLTTFQSCEDRGTIQPFVDGDLSWDGTLAFTIGNEGEYRVWNTRDGRCLRTINQTEPVWRTRFVAQNLLVTGEKDTIKVWRLRYDPDDRAYQYLLAVPESGSAAIEKQAHLSNRLAEVRQLQDRGNHQDAVGILRQLQAEPRLGHNEAVLSALAASAKFGRDPSFKETWSRASFHLGEREGLGGVTYVRFSPDGMMLAAGHREGSIGIYDLSQRKLHCELKRHIGAVVSMVFLDADRLLSLSWNGDVILWHLPTVRGQVLHSKLNVESGAHLSAVLGEDGQRFVVQGLEGYTCIPIQMDQFSELPERAYQPWVTRAKLELDIPFIMKDTKAGYNYQSAASPDGSLFTTTYGDTRFSPHTHPVFVWDLEGGKFRVINKLIGHDKPVLSMAFSTDQTKLVTADLGGEVRLWYLNTNAWVQVIRQADSEFTAVTLSPDGRHILAGDSQGRLFLWTEDGQLLMTNHTHREMVNTLAFSTNGRFAASGGFDNIVQVWEFDWEFHF
jgi:WD40 repeat protein/serine/threonine protein kinase